MKRLTKILLTIVTALSLLLCGLTVSAEELDGCLSDTPVFTQEASGLSLPTLGHVLIIGSTDICDKEIADLFGATYEKADVKSFLESGTLEVKKTPDLVLLLTTDEDTVIREEGKKPQYLSSMKVRTAMKNLYTVIDENTLTAWVTMTDLNNPLSLSEQYRALQNAEDILKKDNFVTSYGYYSSGETGDDRVKTASRILGPLMGGGLFTGLDEAEEPAYHDYVYYVSETGNDKFNGKTPQSPVQTGAKLWKNIAAERGGNMASFGENDRIIVYFTGHVLVGTGQTLMGMSVKTTPRTPEGKHIPVILTTYNYEETKQKAVLYTNYVPHDEGSSRMGIYADLTLRDVIIGSEPKSGALAINKLWTSRCTLTLEGCEFKNTTNVPWVLCSCQNCWDESFEGVPEEEEIRHTLIFKRGLYDETTGVDYVVANAAPYLWRDAKDGGNIPDALNHFSEIIVEKGAVVKEVYGIGNKMPIKGILVDVRPGGEVGVLQLSTDAAAVKEYDNPISVVVNGIVRGEIHGFGKKTEYSGQASIEIENAKLIGAPIKEDDSGFEFLGGRGAALYGSLNVSVKNSLMAMFCGLNRSSGIYFAGTGAILDAEEPFEITVEDTVVAEISNEKLNATEASISFGGAASELYSEYVLNLKNGLFDMTNVEDEFFTFGSVDERGLFYDYTVTLGEQGKKGPAFIGADALIGGCPSWFGAAVAESETEKADTEERFNLTVHDALFSNDVYLLPVAKKNNEERSGISGSVRFTVENGTFSGRTFLANSPVYGDLTVSLLGGTFEDLYDGALESEENRITGTKTIDYENATVKLLNGEEIKVEEPTTEEEHNEGETKKLNLPLILGIGGGVLLLLVLLAVLLIAGKKKKA